MSCINLSKPYCFPLNFSTRLSSYDWLWVWLLFLRSDISSVCMLLLKCMFLLSPPVCFWEPCSNLLMESVNFFSDILRSFMAISVIETALSVWFLSSSRLFGLVLISVYGSQLRSVAHYSCNSFYLSLRSWLNSGIFSICFLSTILSDFVSRSAICVTCVFCVVNFCWLRISDLSIEFALLDISVYCFSSISIASF